jgi:hypothetical protein
MTHNGYIFIAVLCLFILMAWLTIWSRKQSPARMWAIVIALVATPTIAAASFEALSYPRPLWAMWDMQGEYRVLGAKLVQNSGIYLYVETDATEPRSIVLPWNTEQARKVQDLLDEPQTGGQFMMKYEFTWETRDPPQFYPPPQPPALPPKVAPPEAPHYSL